jgi:hypothetical protein
MLPHLADGFPVGRCALADQLKRSLVGTFHAQEEADRARLLVEMQDVSIAHDVVGPSRSDQDQIDVFGDQGFQERSPGFLRHCRIFVGEVDHLDTVVTMQLRQLLYEANRIAMPPARPETALAAIIAEVRTATRELHHHGAQAVPIAVTGHDRSAPNRSGRQRDRESRSPAASRIDGRLCGMRHRRALRWVDGAPARASVAARSPRLRRARSRWRKIPGSGFRASDRSGRPPP